MFLFILFRHDITNFDRNNKACYNLNKGSKSSFHVGKALIHRWQHSKVESYVTNVFYNDPYTNCYLANKYIQPQLLSSHVNLGSGDNACQSSISFHLENNGTLVNKAYWVRFFLIYFWFYILFLTMVFCYQNCSDLLLKFEAEGKIFEINRTIYLFKQ